MTRTKKRNRPRKAKFRWILVNRRKPPFGKSVLFAHQGNIKAHVGWYRESGKWFDWEDQTDINYEPTHWMPLPKLPIYRKPKGPRREAGGKR